MNLDSAYAPQIEKILHVRKKHASKIVGLVNNGMRKLSFAKSHVTLECIMIKKRMRVFVMHQPVWALMGDVWKVVRHHDLCPERMEAAVGVMRKTAAKLGKLCQIQSHKSVGGNSRMRHGSSGAEKFAQCIWEEELHGVS